jgi:anthranilate synthase component 1
MSNEQLVFSPALETCRELISAGKPALLAVTIADDLMTPVHAYLRLAEGKAHSFLLESVEGGKFRGRYSVIGIEPDLLWRVRDGHAEIAEGVDAVKAQQFRSDPRPVYDSLARLRTRCLMPEGDVAGPAAGLFGYLGFSMMGAVEELPEVAPDPVGCPQALMMRPSLVLVFDALKQDITFYSGIWPDETTTMDAQIELAQRRIRKGIEALYAPATELERLAQGQNAIAPAPCLSAGKFETMVEKAKEYIAAGDAFQIVPSQRFTAPFADGSFRFYRALRRLNPSPFLFHFDFGDFAVIGSSPEILVRCAGGEVHIRPLAGTRPRGENEAEDLALEKELLADEKERAEHLMLIDLARNDVGRVAEYGSVEVREQFEIERYSHVMHITSHVVGRLRTDTDPLRALLSGFPAGTVSGTPKIRAVEIIHELEGEDRGIYGGGVGYLSSNGDIDTCIALRTGVIANGVLHVRAGAGVVADSDPSAEREETENKARALFRAADLARRSP